MSNRVKSVIWNALGMVCCILPPLVCLFSNDNLREKSSSWLQQVGVTGIAVLLIVFMVCSKYIKKILSWIFTAPALEFLIGWILCTALANVIQEVALVMKLGLIGSCAGAGCDLISWLYLRKDRKGEG